MGNTVFELALKGIIAAVRIRWSGPHTHSKHSGNQLDKTHLRRYFLHVGVHHSAGRIFCPHALMLCCSSVYLAFLLDGHFGLARYGSVFATERHVRYSSMLVFDFVDL